MLLGGPAFRGDNCAKCFGAGEALCDLSQCVRFSSSAFPAMAYLACTMMQSEISPGGGLLLLASNCGALPAHGPNLSLLEVI